MSAADPTLGMGVRLQAGTLTNVPADGSSEGAIVFPVPFTNAIFNVQAQVILPTGSGTSRATQYTDPQIDNASLTGASVYVAGGGAGDTVSVAWEAIGNQ